MTDWIADLEAKGYRVTITPAPEPEPVEAPPDPVLMAVREAEVKADLRQDRLVQVIADAIELAVSRQPVINVAPPVVTVEAGKAAEIVVPAPIVNVTMPDAMTMDIRSMPKQRRTVTRDNRTGEVTEVVDQ